MAAERPFLVVLLPCGPQGFLAGVELVFDLVRVELCRLLSPFEAGHLVAMAFGSHASPVLERKLLLLLRLRVPARVKPMHLQRR